MRFTKDHEWVEVDGDVATVGITAYAAEQLGDVVFVETPDVGKTVKAGDGFAVVESVKAASDVYAPISGEVVEANAALGDAPETVNAAPEAAGWFAKVKLANPAEVDALMDRHAYEAYLQTLEICPRTTRTTRTGSILKGPRSGRLPDRNHGLRRSHGWRRRDP